MATYTIYADTSDGYISSDSTTYSTARAGNNLTGSDTSTSLYVGQRLSAGTYNCWQAFIKFDTSSVAGTITSATITINETTDNTTTGFTANAYIHDWGTTLTLGDWVAGASLSSLTLVATFNTSNTGAKTGTNVALPENVNQSGTTYILLASDRQQNNNTPTTLEYAIFNSANATGTTNDPYITIVTPSVGRSFGAIFG